MIDQVDNSKDTAKRKEATDEYEQKIKEYHDKRVAYYDSWTKAWINNRVEKDKQLLTLSAIAVGFLVTFYNDLDGIITSIIWLFATISFIVSGMIIYSIFSKNADYIEDLLNRHQTEGIEGLTFKNEDNEENKNSKELTILTLRATRIFLLGIILSITLAILKTEFISNLL